MTSAIRRLDLTDLPACLDLAEEREWGREENKWRLLFEVGAVYGIDAPDGGLAATATGTSYGTVATAVSMVLTARRHERQGLGARVTRHVVAQSGTPTAFLTATPYGRPVYERLGYRTVGEVTALVGEFRGHATGTSRPATPADLPAILELDASVTGLPREILLTRMSTFCLGFRVVDGPSGITGFGGAWRNIDQTVAGPIVAADLETASALLADLAAELPGPIRVDVDRRQRDFFAYAEKSGLEPRFSSTMMEYGPAVRCDPSRMFTMAAQALG